MVGNWFVLYCFVCGTFLFKVFAVGTTQDDSFEFATNFSDSCHSNPCLNDGACIPVEKSYGCICDEPFYGKHCENDPCTPNPCVPGRADACQVVGIDFNCTCVEPYFGKICEKECTCEKGQCIMDSKGEAQCVCPPEFGKYTSKQCQACECGKEANCTFDPGFFSDGKKCICPFDFKETDGKCEDPCTKNPCKNGGTCKVNGNSFKCDCKAPFSGTTCEEEFETTEYYFFSSSAGFDECYCGENSIGCRLDRQANKICSCKSGFAQRRGTEKCSRTCQSNADCLNDGICERDGYGYFCVCPDVYIGDKCEIDVCRYVRYECPSIGAECRRQETVGICECPEGKELSPYGYCEDSCNSETCIHGRCEPSNSNSSYYECKCYYGYYGRNCDFGPSMQSVPYALILVIFASVILFFSIGSIIAGCWVKKLRKKIEEKAKQTVQP